LDLRGEFDVLRRPSVSPTERWQERERTVHTCPALKLLCA
jgi:hypothetical protein